MHVAYSLGWDSSGGSASCAPSLKLFSPTKGPENKVDFSFIKRCTFESFRPQLLAHYLPIHLFRCCKRGLHTLVWITSTSIQICSRSLYLTSRCNKTQSQATNACKHRHIYHKHISDSASCVRLEQNILLHRGMAQCCRAGHLPRSSPV